MTWWRTRIPTVLIGTSGQAHAFTEPVVRAMAGHVKRPVIFPLSNPTDRSEATPAELDAWTDGRAVIATGSPFPPLRRGGKEFRVDQNNNAYVYPGIGLGAIAVRARRISDGMFLAAAKTIAEQSPAKRDQKPTCCRRLSISESFRSTSHLPSLGKRKRRATPTRSPRKKPRRRSELKCGSRFTRRIVALRGREKFGDAISSTLQPKTFALAKLGPAAKIE